MLTVTLVMFERRIEKKVSVPTLLPVGSTLQIAVGEKVGMVTVTEIRWAEIDPGNVFLFISKPTNFGATDFVVDLLWTPTSWTK